jgi:hypothetical protein
MTTSILDNTINQLPTVSFPNIGVTENSCAICLNDYSDGSILLKMPCGHHFHKNCASAWLHINTTCPICRYNLNAPNDDDNRRAHDSESDRLDFRGIAETGLLDNDLNPGFNYIINTFINHINTQFTNEITSLNNEVNNNNSFNNALNNTLVESLINISTRLQNSLVNNENIITDALSNLIAATAPPHHNI